MIWNGTLKFVEKTLVAKNTYHLVAQWQELQTFPQQESAPVTDWNFVAGQFISVEVSPKVWRAYSIASEPNGQKLELVIRLVPDGVGSLRWERLAVGEALVSRGPFGKFGWEENEETSKSVLIATGTGIAPFRSMLKSARKNKNPHPVELWYGGREAEDLAYLDELDSWYPNLKTKLALSREAQMPAESWAKKMEVTSGRVTSLLSAISDQELSGITFYLCGSGAMIDSMKSALEARGVQAKKIVHERFN